MNANKAKANKKRNGRSRRRRPARNNESTMMIMPRHIRRQLRYIDGSYSRNNPGGNYLVYSFRVNDLYDPDPAILSGSISGFKELMQFYQSYRVLYVNIDIQIVNAETFPLMYGFCFTSTNLTGVISSRDDAINALENNLSTRARILSGKGGIDRARLTRHMKIHSIVGDKRTYLSDLDYSGQGLATPAKVLWLNFIVATTTGAVLTNGYATTTNITFDAEFYGLINLRA